MSNSALSVNFAFADGTTKSYTIEPFAVTSTAVSQFKMRLKTFNSVDETTQKKFTNLAKFLMSENVVALTGIKSAHITTSEITRIYDAADYGG